LFVCILVSQPSECQVTVGLVELSFMTLLCGHHVARNYWQVCFCATTHCNFCCCYKNSHLFISMHV